MKLISFLLVLILISISGCATTVEGVKNWIGDAGSPVSKTSLIRVYTWSPKPIYTQYYRAGDNDYNYYQYHNKRISKTPSLKPGSGIVMEGREAIYYYGHWDSRNK